MYDLTLFVSLIQVPYEHLLSFNLNNNINDDTTLEMPFPELLR